MYSPTFQLINTNQLGYECTPIFRSYTHLINEGHCVHLFFFFLLVSESPFVWPPWHLIHLQCHCQSLEEERLMSDWILTLDCGYVCQSEVGHSLTRRTNFRENTIQIDLVLRTTNYFRENFWLQCPPAGHLLTPSAHGQYVNSETMLDPPCWTAFLSCIERSDLLNSRDSHWVNSSLWSGRKAANETCLHYIWCCQTVPENTSAQQCIIFTWLNNLLSLSNHVNEHKIMLFLEKVKVITHLECNNAVPQ